MFGKYRLLTQRFYTSTNSLMTQNDKVKKLLHSAAEKDLTNRRLHNRAKVVFKKALEHF